MRNNGIFISKDVKAENIKPGDIIIDASCNVFSFEEDFIDRIYKSYFFGKSESSVKVEIYNNDINLSTFATVKDVIIENNFVILTASRNNKSESMYSRTVVVGETIRKVTYSLFDKKFVSIYGLPFIKLLNTL